jgi:PAS domain S-box-containing protein
MRIILVDDDPDCRAVVTQKLSRDFPDLQLRTVSDADGFARAVDAGDFDLVITESQLSWGNGLDVLKAVKTHWPDRPVIMLTESQNEEVALQLMRAGLDDYVLKSPKRVARLPIVVRAAMERSALFSNAYALETRYHRLISNLPLGFYRITLGGEWLEINPAAQRLFGFASAEEVLMRRVPEPYADPADREQLLQELREQGQVAGWHVRMRRADGAIFWAELQATLVRGENGEPRIVEIILDDVTERKKVEDLFPQTQTPDSPDLWVRGIAHDFNNILMAIMGGISLARAHTKSGDQIFHILKETEQTALRAKDLTRQLLTFSKGRVPLRSITSVARLVQDTTELALKGSGMRCQFAIPGDLWPIEVDQGQMSQVIYNLVINASQAMSGRGLIRVRAENAVLGTDQPRLKPGRYVKIAVQDQGVGIPESHLPRIFDTYFTTKQKGTGLGLAIANLIIKNHGGHIAVESELGRGTTFTIYLPASEKHILAQRGEEKAFLLARERCA